MTAGQGKHLSAVQTTKAVNWMTRNSVEVARLSVPEIVARILADEGVTINDGRARSILKELKLPFARVVGSWSRQSNRSVGTSWYKAAKVMARVLRTLADDLGVDLGEDRKLLTLIIAQRLSEASEAVVEKGEVLNE